MHNTTAAPAAVSGAKADNPNPDPDTPRPTDNSKHAATNSIVAKTEQLPAPADKHGERSIAAACRLLVASLPEGVLQNRCAAACQLFVANPPECLLNEIGHHPMSSSVPENDLLCKALFAGDCQNCAQKPS